MAFPNHSGTKCPKCDNSSFTLVEDFPANANFKMYYIRCASCNTFLQALPYYDTNSKIEALQEDINKIKSKLGVY
jgi:formate dehydrogenase maturation protein FdhE